MSLYSPSERPHNTLNRLAAMSDGSGTINPAALTGNVVLPTANIDPSPRGIKRSRSPDTYGDYAQGDDNDDSKPRKRGRPSKTPRTSGDFNNEQIGSLPTPASQTSPELVQTPQIKTQTQQVQIIGTQNQTSPVQKQTPTKPTLKALPTVRDHTSDQLNPEGDEYIPREYDDSGEGKVDNNGYLQGGREYKLRTFVLPGRGDKLFMLATECARTLQYRDSYLLFNKNRSLFKIIAQPKEKEELVSRDILPYSYRSRQIAIVTARSMFRQFGSRVIKDGRRVRDDYWEAKARKQGFTEEDAAGEKRPGAARAREAALAEAHAGRPLTAYGDIVYSNGPTFGAIQPPPLQSGLVGSTMAQLPTIDAYDNSKYRDIARPRLELNGPPYADVTRTSSEAEMASQSGHAADYSKNVNAQGRYRRQIVEDYWHRPHDPPVSTPQPQSVEPATTQAYTSPRFNSNDLGAQQPSILSQQQAAPSVMNPPNFSHQHNPLQSPVRQSSMSQNFPRESSQFTPQHPQYSRSTSNLSISQTPAQQNMNYSGGAFSPQSMNPQHQQQSWGGPPPQPHQSPGMHRMATPQFSPSLGHGQIPSPMGTAQHPSQSPHPQQMQPPMAMLQHQNNMGGQAGQQLFGPGAGLQAMNAAGYSNMGIAGQRAMFGMGGQGGAAQFMQSQGQQQQQNPNWHAPPGQAWSHGLQ